MMLQPAQLEFNADGLPRSTLFDDVYYSDADPIAESEEVFIKAHELNRRWQQQPGANGSFVIAELGFGFGLNFMLTLRQWLDHGEGRLHYLAFEKHPPDADALKRVHDLWPALQELGNALRAQYPRDGGGCHRILLQENVILDLYLGDAATELQRRIPLAVDCWYLDGFSPANNQELWHESVLSLIADSSGPGTTLSSYSVAGALRRGLENSGFSVQKLPGFGRKRHRLFARFNTGEATAPSSFWLPAVASCRQPGSATVIGAGLAGSAIASSLARRGLQVSVLEGSRERQSGINSIGSLSLRLRILREDSPVSRFYLLGYLYSLRLLRELARQNQVDWHEVGLVQLSSALNNDGRLGQSSLDEFYGESIIRPLSRGALSAIAGLNLSSDGYHLPHSGYVDPAQLIAALLDHPNIKLCNDCEVKKIDPIDQGWQVTTTSDARFQDDVLIIAAGAGSKEISQLSHVPLQSVKGQVTRITATKGSSDMKTIVCGERTVFPAGNDGQVIAASYGDDDAMKTDRENLERASSSFQNTEILSEDILGNAQAFRCRSEDYLPVAGPVPHWESMATLLAPLKRNASHRLDTPGIYQPGLFVSTAHGSNGLSSCPLVADYLASLVCGENLPLDRDTAQCLHPLRFQVRKAKRQLSRQV